jgi:steroid 5-alpha reductase family enzyme
MSSTLLLNAIVVLAAMLALWIVATLRRDVSLVDIFWGPGFAVVAWLSMFNNPPHLSRDWLLTLLTTIWAGRLALYIAWRNWGKGEDRRYAAMRDHHGRHFVWVSLLTVFGLQGLLLWLIALPMQISAALNLARPLGVLDYFGAALWLVGFIFEAGGDWQMARFQADPANKGRVMDKGFWRYTRHPNYFGDFCVWWGLYLIAAAGGAWYTILSPLVMSGLLLKVSGVALLEQTIGERRPAYAQYARRTNAFFPGPPRDA